MYNYVSIINIWDPISFLISYIPRQAFEVKVFRLENKQKNKSFFNLHMKMKMVKNGMNLFFGQLIMIVHQVPQVIWQEFSQTNAMLL